MNSLGFAFCTFCALQWLIWGNSMSSHGQEIAVAAVIVTFPDVFKVF